MSNIAVAVIQFLGAVGGGAVVVFALIKFFGKRIFEHHINRLTEKYKLKLNLEFDRISKLNQKEFEILPTLWEYVVTFRSMVLFYSDKKTLYDDLNQYSNESLIEFLNGNPIPEYHKKLIIESSDKNETYVRVVNVLGYESIKQQFNLFDSEYKYNKIFFTKKISECLADIHKYYHECFMIYLNIQGDAKAILAFRTDFDKISLVKIDGLGNLIKDRLRFVDE